MFIHFRHISQQYIAFLYTVLTAKRHCERKWCINMMGGAIGAIGRMGGAIGAIGSIGKATQNFTMKGSLFTIVGKISP